MRNLFKTTFALTALLLVISIVSCQKEETVAIDDVSIEKRLSKDDDFNNLISKIYQTSSNYASELSSIDKSEKGKIINLIQNSSENQEAIVQIGNSINYTKSDEYKANLKEIQVLSQIIISKYPEIRSLTTDQLQLITNNTKTFQQINLNRNLKVGKNCRGVYEAKICLITITALTATVACGPGAPICAGAATAVAGCAMELARQEYIDCLDI